MSDLISRQAAIDAVSSMFAPTPTQKDMVEDCLEIIENLPSAQPEIIRCKDCKWYVPISENYGKCTYRMREHLLNEPSDYCSYGERKDNE